MARGRRGFETETITISRGGSRPIDEYDFDAQNTVHKANRYADHYYEDRDALVNSSKRQDRALLNDITSRLYKLDFESVKPSKNVQWQTGFRRKGRMYKDLPYVEKDNKKEWRKDQLRYPWDYTTENIYHKKPKIKPRKKKLRDVVLDADKEIPEEKDPYPKYDPLGLYRPREKRTHKPLPNPNPRYEDKSVQEMLTQLRIKSQLMPRGRSAKADVDVLLEDLNRPLPKSSVADFTPATVGYLDYDSDDYTPSGPDSLLKKKIDISHKELDEFDRLLDERFRGGKKSRVGPDAQILAARAAAEQSARESQRQRMMAASIAIENSIDDDYRDIRTPKTDPQEYYFDDEEIPRRNVMVRSASLPRSLPRRYIDDIETDVEIALERDMHPPMSMTALRSKAVNARSKMDQHRTMLDRYLPLDLTTGNDVGYEVESKYGELVQRMPQLDPYRPKVVPVVSTNNYLRHKPPVGPQVRGPHNNYGLQERATYSRPPLSEARRNARAVLCRTKGDPHYFS